MHSFRHPLKDNKILDPYHIQNHHQLIIVGAGLGYMLMDLSVDIVSRSCLFFYYEEERELFIKYYQTLVNKKPLPKYLFLFSEESQWKKHIALQVISDIIVVINPIYESLLGIDIHESIAQIQIYMKQLLMNQITDIAFGFRWWRNFLRNYMIDNFLVWPQNIKKPSSLPVLLVGSALSSYQNIKTIASYKNYYIIIAVPPVLDLLLAYNIEPDILVMTDGGVANRFYSSIQKLSSSVKMICYPHVFFHSIRYFSGEIFFINSGLEQEELLTPNIPVFPSGGSVASTALDIACTLSHNIFIIGFDFGYTHYHPHYPGSPLETHQIFESDRYRSFHTKFSILVYQKGIFWDKNNIYTSSVLKSYAEYFEKQVDTAKKNHYTITNFHVDSSTFLDPLDKKESLMFLSAKKLPYSLRKDRLTTLKKILHNNKENSENPRILSLLLARAKAKKEDTKRIIDQEIKWLEKLLR